MRLNSGGGRRAAGGGAGAASRAGAGNGPAQARRGSPRPGWGKVAGGTEAPLGPERAGEWSLGRWDKDFLRVGRGRGGGCLLLKCFPALGVGGWDPGGERVIFLSASSINRSGSSTGARTSGGGGGGNKLARGSREG